MRMLVIAAEMTHVLSTKLDRLAEAGVDVTLITDDRVRGLGIHMSYIDDEPLVGGDLRSVEKRPMRRRYIGEDIPTAPRSIRETRRAQGGSWNRG